MTVKFEFPKLILVTIAVFVLFFTVVGVQTVWTEYIVKDYDKQLTEQVYVDAAVNQNVNLVFYKKGCPYCEKGKIAVIDAAEKSPYPTFYIDVESEAGQVLVKKYQDSELWRAKTPEGMVVLGKLPDGIFTLLRFNDDGGKLTHISESEALWLTLELAPEKMDYI